MIGAVEKHFGITVRSPPWVTSSFRVASIRPCLTQQVVCNVRAPTRLATVNRYNRVGNHVRTKHCLLVCHPKRLSPKHDKSGGRFMGQLVATLLTRPVMAAVSIGWVTICIVLIVVSLMLLTSCLCLVRFYSNYPPNDKATASTVADLS